MLILVLVNISISFAAHHHHKHNRAGMISSDIAAEVKERWVELRGEDVEEALKKIKDERPELTVVKVESGSMVTMDYRLDRVRVYFDPETNKVTSPPKLG